MHTILHKLQNGGVGNYTPNPKVVAIMMAKGFGWASEDCAWEISKMMEPVDAEAAAEGKITYTEAMATEWVLALCDGGLTEDQAMDLFTRRIQQRRGYTESATVEAADLPYHILGNGDPNHGPCGDPKCHDRYFRNAVAWDDSSTIKCRWDKTKADAIHMVQVRRVRDAELVKLDVPFMRAVEAGDVREQARIASMKQVLRDIPQNINLEAADTPEALKALWPAELPR